MILTDTMCFFCFFRDGLKLKHLKPSRNDHHCSLTVPAVRHVWPLLEGSQQWRYDILSLLFEWSQRSISAKAMAEFAARYPQHLQMLIDIVAKEKKEDALPPGKGGTGKKRGGWSIMLHLCFIMRAKESGDCGLEILFRTVGSLPFHTFLLCFFKFTMAIVPTGTTSLKGDYFFCWSIQVKELVILIHIISYCQSSYIYII